MIDIKFLRENPEVVKKNIEKKFQNEKKTINRGERGNIWETNDWEFPRKKREGYKTFY